MFDGFGICFLNMVLIHSDAHVSDILGKFARVSLLNKLLSVCLPVGVGRVVALLQLSGVGLGSGRLTSWA